MLGVLVQSIILIAVSCAVCCVKIELQLHFALLSLCALQERCCGACVCHNEVFCGAAVCRNRIPAVPCKVWRLFVPVNVIMNTTLLNISAVM